MPTVSTVRLIVPLLVVASASQTARAEDVDACSVAYARGQEERLAGRLFNARTAFQQCATAACSTALTSDCSRWVKEVEADLPTIRVSVRDQQRAAVENLRVLIDGAVTPLGALSAPIVLEAGPHELRFEAPGYQSVHFEKALRPSDREVPVVVTLRPPPPPARRPQTAPVPTASWVLVGVGAVALGGSIYFGVKANDQYHELKQSCAPTCERSASDSMQTNAVISDVALAGAVVALAGAVVIYFTRTAKPPATAVNVGARRGGVMVSF